MEAANKEAAEECLSKAQAAFRKGSFKEALRLARNSSLCCYEILVEIANR